MQYYVTETNGNLGFYCDEIHGINIPKDAIPITEAIWQNAVNNPGKYSIQNGAFIAATVWPPPPDPATVIKAQIAALEAQQTPRMYREAMAGSTVTNEDWKNADGSYRTSAQQLAWLDNKITALRAQLQE